MSPTISTKKSKQKRKLAKSNQAKRREKIILLSVIIGGSVSVLLHLFIQIGVASSAADERESEIYYMRADRVLDLEEDAAKFERELRVAKNASTENTAGLKRAKEFERRRALDPAFAVTDFEKNMLEMQRIGQDPSVAPNEALERIAKLASPPKSGVGVFEDGEGLYRVEVAFPYGKVVEDNARIEKDLDGIYLQVRREAAGIARDILAFGAGRGVTGVTVSCQDNVTIKGREKDKRKERRDMYIISAVPGGLDWSAMSRGEAEKACKKVRDVFPRMLKNR